MTDAQDRTLVLQDDAQNLYAIPMTEIERYRVAPDQVLALRERLTAEVQGFDGGTFGQLGPVAGGPRPPITPPPPVNIIAILIG